MNSGFYKNDNGILLYGPNFVLNKDYELRRETCDQHAYPVDGWSWFDSEEEARTALDIPLEEQPEPEADLPVKGETN